MVAPITGRGISGFDRTVDGGTRFFDAFGTPTTQWIFNKERPLYADSNRKRGRAAPPRGQLLAIGYSARVLRFAAKNRVRRIIGPCFRRSSGEGSPRGSVTARIGEGPRSSKKGRGGRFFPGAGSGPAGAPDRQTGHARVLFLGRGLDGHPVGPRRTMEGGPCAAVYLAGRSFCFAPQERPRRNFCNPDLEPGLDSSPMWLGKAKAPANRVN